jgi:hypothetical protein
MLQRWTGRVGFAAVPMCVLAMVVASPGCNKSPVRPTVKTYPVTGKVVLASGHLPRGSNIMFEPADPKATARSIIADDGSFTLTTVFFESKLPGAVEGPHRVTVVPALTADGEGARPAIVLKETYTVKPKENQFTIKIE